MSFKKKRQIMGNEVFKIDLQSISIYFCSVLNGKTGRKSIQHTFSNLLEKTNIVRKNKENLLVYTSSCFKLHEFIPKTHNNYS